MNKSDQPGCGTTFGDALPSRIRMCPRMPISFGLPWAMDISYELLSIPPAPTVGVVGEVIGRPSRRGRSRRSFAVGGGMTPPQHTRTHIHTHTHTHTSPEAQLNTVASGLDPRIKAPKLQPHFSSCEQILLLSRGYFAPQETIRTVKTWCAKVLSKWKRNLQRNEQPN